MSANRNDRGWVPSPALLGLGLLAGSGLVVVLMAQQFRITGVSIAPDGRSRVQHEADMNYCSILYRGGRFHEYRPATKMALGRNGEVELTDPARTVL